MRLEKLAERLIGWIKPGFWSGHSPVRASRGPLVHIIILDGTLSTLTPGEETNAGLTYRLLAQMGVPVSLYYEAGVQMAEWHHAPDVLMGRGINRQIRRAYGYLASRYRPGDKVFLFGYSRGAYGVRSLGGMIDQVGLLKSGAATERNIQLAYRHYQSAPGSPACHAFRAAHCHADFEIEMIGVWDTVKALGMRLPVLWKWDEEKHSFHTHDLGKITKRGFQALALDETRSVFQPVLWGSEETGGNRVQQVWFRGTHGDIGGQLGGFAQARPLSNIPLVWMLERAQGCGLPLPEGWRDRFPCDPGAPSVGTWRGWGKIFLLRSRRIVGADPSEVLHETVPTARQRNTLLHSEA